MLVHVTQDAMPLVLGHGRVFEHGARHRMGSVYPLGAVVVRVRAVAVTGHERLGDDAVD
jgi:hypothetical protein